MNSRQRRFCQYYAADPNGARAAEAAGYSPRTARQIASTLLTKHDIQSLIAELTAEQDAERIASAREIQVTWTEILRDPSTLQRDRLKAGELLAKTRGLFRSTGVEINVQPPQSTEPEDIVIFLPELLTEEECEYHEEDESS